MSRIAIFSPARLCADDQGRYSPALLDLIRRIAEHHEVLAFSVEPPGLARTRYLCGSASVRPVGTQPGDRPQSIFLQSVAAFLAEHRRRPFDLVHGFRAVPGGLAAVAASRTARIPSVVTFLGAETASLHAIGYGNQLSPVLRLLTAIVARKSDCVVALTEHQQRAMTGLITGIRPPAVIPFGVDAALFPPLPPRTPGAPFRFVAVGDINAVKDHRTMIDVCERLRRTLDFQLTIIGHDLLGGTLQQIVRERRLDACITFAGYRPHGELPAWYGSSHILLHTSRHESESLAVAEAMASGAVPCGTRVGLLADLDGIATLTAQPEDGEGLAAGISSLLADRGRYSTLAREGLRWAVRNTAELTATRYLMEYEYLMRDRTVRPHPVFS